MVMTMTNAETFIKLTLVHDSAVCAEYNNDRGVILKRTHQIVDDVNTVRVSEESKDFYFS